MPEPISQTNASVSKTTRCDAWGIGPSRWFRAWLLRADNSRSEAERVTGS
jgi:hypothetical protein